MTGWIAHRRPFAFETGAIDPREDSFRYLNGTPHIPALYACRPGLDILNKVGIAAIREKSIRMTTRLIEGAKSRGWRVNTPEIPRSVREPFPSSARTRTRFAASSLRERF